MRIGASSCGPSFLSIFLHEEEGRTMLNPGYVTFTKNADPFDGSALQGFSAWAY